MSAQWLVAFLQKQPLAIALHASKLGTNLPFAIHRQRVASDRRVDAGYGGSGQFMGQPIPPEF